LHEYFGVTTTKTVPINPVSYLVWTVECRPGLGMQQFKTISKLLKLPTILIKLLPSILSVPCLDCILRFVKTSSKWI